MATLMIAVAAMTVGAAVGFLTARLICGTATHEAGQPDRTRGGGDRISELQLKNSRLRRLVTDLLLEKIELEEVAQREKSPREETR